ncbi:unnamed protein product, partial [Meganyctiphanes norvegica]
IDDKLTNQMQDKFSDVSDSFHQMNITVQGIVSQQDSSNHEIISKLRDLENKQSNNHEDYFSGINTTLSQMASTLEVAADNLSSIKDITEKNGESSSQTKILQEFKNMKINASCRKMVLWKHYRMKFVQKPMGSSCSQGQNNVSSHSWISEGPGLKLIPSVN